MVPCRHDCRHRVGDGVCPDCAQATRSPKPVQRSAFLVVGPLRVGMAVPPLVRQPRIGTSIASIQVPCWRWRSRGMPPRRTSPPNGSSKVRPWPAPSHGAHGAWGGRSPCRQGLDAVDVPHPLAMLAALDGLGAPRNQDQPFPLWRPWASRRSRLAHERPSVAPRLGPGAVDRLVRAARPVGGLLAITLAPAGNGLVAWPVPPFLRRNFPRSPRRAMPTSTILSGWCPKVIPPPPLPVPHGMGKRGPNQRPPPRTQRGRLHGPRSAAPIPDLLGWPKDGDILQLTPKMFGPLNRRHPRDSKGSVALA